MTGYEEVKNLQPLEKIFYNLMVALKAFTYSLYNVHEVEGQVEKTKEF